MSKKLIREARNALKPVEKITLKGDGWGIMFSQNPNSGKNIIRMRENDIVLICVRGKSLRIFDYHRTDRTNLGDESEAALYQAGLPCEREGFIFPSISSDDEVFVNSQYVLICPRCKYREKFDFGSSQDKDKNETLIVLAWKKHKLTNPGCAKVSRVQIIRSDDMVRETELEDLVSGKSV